MSLYVAGLTSAGATARFVQCVGIVRSRRSIIVILLLDSLLTILQLFFVLSNIIA